MREILVRKRNSDLVSFNKDKIVQALSKAFIETELGLDNDLVVEIADSIEDDVVELVGFIPTVEVIQDMCEEYLMDSDRKDCARRYILYRSERSKLRDQGWEMTDLQKDIYEQKYRFENESFDEFLDRVSGGNSQARKLIADRKFSPAGRILAGRGLNEKGRKVVYSNCFVLDSPQDNLESIFDTAKKMARTYSMGGGVGINISKLRPKGATVNNAAKNTSGAVSFMDLFSLTTGLIGQSGRRGALMISMEVSHPEILDFIRVKSDLDKVTKANISVMTNDDFMRAVKNNENWEMSFTNLENGETVSKTESARSIMRLLAEINYDYGEPGLLHFSRVQNWHLNSEDPDFEYISTNP